jgi:mRNA interferase MazF
MPARRFVPERGDFVWIDLNPRKGHEQAGRRPALVLSPSSYNRKTGLCVICPATRQAKGYAFEVTQFMPDGSVSVVLSDHVRCVDWKTRNVKFIVRVAPAVLQDVVAKLEALIIDPDA